MKLLASDYDGTLKFGDTVAESDVEAIKAWKEAGNLFALVTGRSSKSIFDEAEKYGIPVDYYVTNNGGMVFDADGNPLMTSQLDTMTAIDLMFVAKEMNDVVSYMVNNGYIRHKIVVNPNLEDHRYPHIDPDWTEEQIMDSGQFAQIVFSMRDPEAAIAFADSINHYFGSQVAAYPNNFVVDVCPHGVSKATGLEFIAEYGDIPEMDVYCMGDSYNDVPMLAACFNSCASALSPEDVQENARWVYPTIGDFVTSIQNEEI